MSFARNTNEKVKLGYLICQTFTIYYTVSLLVYRSFVSHRYLFDVTARYPRSVQQKQNTDACCSCCLRYTKKSFNVRSVGFISRLFAVLFYSVQLKASNNVIIGGSRVKWPSWDDAKGGVSRRKCTIDVCWLFLPALVQIDLQRPFSHHASKIHSSAFDSMGKGLEITKYTEKLVPSTRFVAVDGMVPKISDKGAFVAPSAAVIGDVTIGKASR